MFKIRKVAVLGAGVMGAQIAAHCVNAGVPVVLFDLASKEGDASGIARRGVAQLTKLNPAPFCLLDEVDAPLDDANVERYARLVKEMSAKVQFIYITHNKIAMQMASHLLGVTMHEPGCSRLVAVDIDEALAQAG